MNIIHLSKAEYQTLSTTGTLTKSGVTYTFDPLNNEYVVPDQKFTHVLRCTYNNVGDNAGLTGVLRFTNDVATAYTAATISNEIIAKAFDSVAGIVIETGYQRLIPSTMDSNGTLWGISPDSNIVTSWDVNFADTTSITFTDTVIARQ